MKKRNALRFRHTALAAAAATALGTLVSLPAFAQELPLVQYPAGTASRAPAPNLILTLDDSGSMTARDGGPNGMTRNQALRNALADTFSSSNPDVADGRIRLAWQMLNNCVGFPSRSGGCNNQNLMRPLEGADNDTSTHRGRFLAWASQIPANGWTPVHGAFQAAGQYLQRTDSENPWLNKPGDSTSGFLPCRRSYQILMTDGGWNAANGFNTSSISPLRADRTETTFPDNKKYTPQTAQTNIYTNANTNNFILQDWRWNGRTTVWVNDRIGPTISDLAFFFWSRDLQPSIPNEAHPLMRVTVNEEHTFANRSVSLEPYWNPKNDPSIWQNMITYTIGFGDAASFNDLRWDTTTDDMYSTDVTLSDYSALITGARTWSLYGTRSASGSYGGQQNRSDMWHAAINGRGRFIPARNASDLRRAFSTILSQIAADNTKPITSFTASSASFSRNGTNFYNSGYDAGQNWRGYVAAQKLSSSGSLLPDMVWGTTGSPARAKTTADLLDERTDIATGRLILTSYTDHTNPANPRLSAGTFLWNALKPQQKLDLQALGSTTASAAIGKDRLDYLRGDRSKEGGTNGFRTRTSRQGDIVNSTLWYAEGPASDYAFGNYPAFAHRMRGRTPMIYVGGNDGMLHGFSATSGQELIAYVPQGVYKNLSRLTSSQFDTSHHYFVDGSPFVGDVQTGGARNPWRSYLVGTLAAGGKGYFVLDVTNPGGTIAAGSDNPPAFNAANANQLVVLDKTDGVDPDIGHIFGEPLTEEGNPQRPLQITQVNDGSANGRWALITGNGINSTNGQPVLIVQYLDGANKETIKIPAATTGPEATGNGLSTPRPLDVNGDGKVDFVYAGDLRGNLWKFDLSSNNASQWKVASFGGTQRPLFTAVSAAGARQPITSAPLIKPNGSVGGLMVAFGTGRNVTENDRTDTAAQSFYAVLDQTRYKPAGNNVEIDSTQPNPAVTDRTSLVSRTYTATSVAGTGSATGLQFWGQEQSSGSTNAPVEYAGSNAKRGWYFDLPESGERVLRSNEFYDGSRLIEIKSIIPASGGSTAEESCESNPKSARGFRTLINIETGNAPGLNVMDVNGDRLFNAVHDNVSTGIVASRSTAAPVEIGSAGRNVNIRYSGGAAGKLPETVELRRLPIVMLRPSWRQLQ